MSFFQSAINQKIRYKNEKGKKMCSYQGKSMITNMGDNKLISIFIQNTLMII